MNMLSILSLAVVGLLIASVRAAVMPSKPFQPLTESSLPDNTFGKMVRQGQTLFAGTRKNTPHLVGSQLNCVNRHLEQGRQANSAPQWVAYPVYPAFCAENNGINTFVERPQSCFQFSVNGKVPAIGGPEIKALTVHAYWLTSQVPAGVSLPGRGYPDVAPPEGGYSIEYGVEAYTVQCTVYHNADGQDQIALGQAMFPPLQGTQLFSWDADMHRINTAISFIKYNMPLGEPDTPSDRDTWGITAFMNSHGRPQDPRLVDGSVEEARQKLHANDGVDLYGQGVNDALLGQGIRPSQPGVRRAETWPGGSRPVPGQGG